MDMSFLKDGVWRIMVQSDIEELALRDTDKPPDDTAKDLVNQQKEGLEGTNKQRLQYSIQMKIYPSTPIN
jgi:hypothetical protein